MNIINFSLLLVEVIFLFILVFKTYKKNSINGLYYLIIIFNILANIFMMKRIEVYTLELNVGLILNLMIFVISNILIQKQGPETLKKVLIIIFLTTLFSYAMLTFSGLLVPGNYNKFTNIPYNNIFEYNIKMYIGSLIALILSLLVNSSLYYFLKKTKNKVWISNTLSMIIIQFIEAILFVAISYIYVLEPLEIIFLILSRYIVKTIVGLLSIIIISPISKIDD